jgi:MFS family permease
MVFAVFAPLVFLILRLAVRWRWRTVFVVALVLGVLADFVLESLVARRP